MEADRWSLVSKNTVTYWSLFSQGVRELGRRFETRRDRQADRKDIFIEINSERFSRQTYITDFSGMKYTIIYI